MLHRDRAPSANCAADHGDLTGPVLGFAVDAPVVVQRQVLGFDSGYIFCVSLRRALWKISHIFYVKVLDPQVDSRFFLLTRPKRKWRARRQHWQWHAFSWFCW